MTSQNCDALLKKYSQTGVFGHSKQFGGSILPIKLPSVAKFRENRFKDVGENWVGKQPDVNYNGRPLCYTEWAVREMLVNIYLL